MPISTHICVNFFLLVKAALLSIIHLDIRPKNYLEKHFMIIFNLNIDLKSLGTVSILKIGNREKQTAICWNPLNSLETKLRSQQCHVAQVIIFFMLFSICISGRIYTFHNGLCVCGYFNIYVCMHCIYAKPPGGLNFPAQFHNSWHL